MIDCISMIKLQEPAAWDFLGEERKETESLEGKEKQQKIKEMAA